jgi:hypothetical protein
VRDCAFEPGTRVLLADGTTTPIEDVKTGDVVVATDPETGRTEAKKVTRTITGHGDKSLVEITIDVDGPAGKRTATVVATDGHPFWVPMLDAWIDATDLQPGQWLHTSAGTWTQLTALRRYTATATVHNLTVADTHTYYVLAGNTPVLVHNCGTGGDSVTLYRNVDAAELTTSLTRASSAPAKGTWRASGSRRRKGMPMYGAKG